MPVALTDSDAGGESTPVSEEPLKGLYGNTMAWDEGKKTYTLTADTTVNLTADKTIDARFVGDYKLTIKSTGNGSPFTLTCSYDFKDVTPDKGDVNAMFKINALKVEGANLTATVKNSQVQGCFIYNVGGLEVSGKSIVTISNENADRIMAGGTTMKIDGKDATVIVNGASSFSTQLTMTSGATLEIENPKNTAGNIYANGVDGATITVTGAKTGNHGLFFYGAKTSAKGESDAGVLTNSTITTDGMVGFYGSDKEIDATGTTIKADTLGAVRATKVMAQKDESGNITVSAQYFEAASISGATLMVKEIVAPITPGYQSHEGQTLNMDGVVFAGKTTVSKGAEVVLSGESFVNAGAALDVAKDATVSFETDSSKLIVGGTTNLENGKDKTNIEFANEKKDAAPTTESELNKYLAAETKKVSYNGDITADIKVLPGTTLDLTKTDGATIASGVTLEIDGIINGKVVGGSGTSIGTGVFSNFKGDFALKAGSVDINGETFTGGTYYATNGTTKISGNITGDVYLVIASGAKVQVDGTLNIIAGATLYITDMNAKSDGFSVPNNSSLNLFGSIRMLKESTTPAATMTAKEVVITVVEKPEGSASTVKAGSFKAFSGSGISGVTVAGKGSIDLSQAQSPQTVGEDISYDKTYGQLEDVTIVGSLTIKNNSTVIVMGGFNVNENVTLTIEKGSKLIISSVAASMVVDGRIIVEEGATLEVEAAKDVKVSGSIESEGTVVIASKVTVKSNGFIHINDATVTGSTYASNFTAGSDLTVEAGAELVIKSQVKTATTISNKGSVVLNGAVLGGTLTINMLADSAVVDIQSVTGTSKVTITDNGLKFADKKTVVGTTVGYTDKANEVNFTLDSGALKGLTVTEKVTSYVKDEKTYYTNTFELTGAVTITDESGAVTGTVNVTGKNLSVPEKLDLGKKVTLAVGANSVLKVAGTITATATGSADTDKSVITSAGDIQVTGLIQTVKKIDSGINAAMYETKTGTTTIYNYTTLNAAIAAAAKDIQVLGTISVLESATIPAGTTVKNNGTIIVGSDDNTDVVLTVADTGSIKNGTVEVKGTLVFDNKKDNRTVVVSDVSVIGEKEARYTNIYTALAQANPGDTVTIDKNEVELKKSITIKDGVTLDVPLTKKLIVSEGITITVVGTLKTAEKIEGAAIEGTTENVGFALEPSVREHKATIVVSGTFMSMADVKYDYYFVPGAYYQNTDSAGVYNYVTTLENASKSAAVSVTVYGKVTAGDVVFAGTTATRTLNVASDAELAATSITLDKAKFIATGRFSGDVKVGDSAVTAKFATFEAKINDDGMLIVDNIKKKISGNEKASFKVSAGTVNVKNSAFGITVSAGATLAADATAITGKLTIDGTVTVDNGKTMSVSGDVIVNGTLTVAEITDTKAPGTFTLSDTALLYIGITEDDIVKSSTGADASVSGTITAVKTAFVKAGASVSEATIDSFKAGDKLVSTTYVVEGKDWMTVYDRTGEYAIKTVDKAPVENAKFKQWLKTDGKAVDNSVIGASKCDKVTADVDYEIYTIVINPAAGIESIAVDGNLMIKHSETGMYRMTVKAGTHEITCKLANGYSGDAQFSLVKSEAVADGTFNASVSGNKVTVSGDSGTVTVQITGVSASGYVDPTPVVPEEKDDGMSLTDILLIVLVVLIVIMAVIVAMRLMRS